MSAPVPRRPPAAAASTTTLTPRDIAGLVFTAEMYGVQLDQLATVLSLSEQSARATAARWRARGYADTERLGPGRPWFWLTRAGLTTCCLHYTFATTPLSLLAHLRAFTAS